jgi:DNA-nicking Smr family endonuclease
MSSVGPYDYYKSYAGYADSGVDYEVNDRFYRRVEDKNYRGLDSPISADSNSDHNDSSPDDKLDLEDYNRDRRRAPMSPVMETLNYRGQGYHGEWKGNNSEAKSCYNSPVRPESNDDFMSGRQSRPVEAIYPPKSDIYYTNQLPRRQQRTSPYSSKIDTKRSNQQAPRSRTESARFQNESFQSDISHVQIQKSGKKNENIKDDPKDNIPVHGQDQNQVQDYSLIKEFLLEASADTLAMTSFLSGMGRHIEEEADLELKVLDRFLSNILRCIYTFRMT